MSSIIFHGALHFAGENHRPSFRIVTPYATSETVEVRRRSVYRLRITDTIALLSLIVMA
jgi:hypothetical protein